MQARYDTRVPERMEKMDGAVSVQTNPDAKKTKRLSGGGRRRKVLLIFLASLGFAAASYGTYWWFVARYVVSTDNAYAEADIAIVSAKVDGLIQDVLVDDNQPVKAGDILVRIRDTEHQARLREADATVSEAKARLGVLQAQLNQQQAVIDQASAGLAASSAERERASKDYGRVTGMDVQFVSRQKHDAALADLRKAQAAESQNEAAVAAARDQVTILQQSVAEAEAVLKRTEAERDLAAQNLRDTEIRAGFDGVIGNKSVQVGQYVRPGQSLMALVPVAETYITANFKETQIAHLLPGQTVEITFDAFPGVTIDGKVASFAPASGAEFSLLPPENATGNFTKVVQRIPVRIMLPPQHALTGRLRPGLSAFVSIDTRDKSE